MDGKVESRGPTSPQSHFSPLNEYQKAAVLRQLRHILDSQTFRTSRRCQQFLSYVVEHTLEGHDESLKERTIGVELFQRLPTYTTGEDPVVRVRAGEVRKRLIQYYAQEAQSPEVRIDIPTGAYIPEFHWSSAEAAARKGQRRPSENRVRFGVAMVSLIGLGLIVVLAVVIGGRKPTQSVSVLDQFWEPLLKTSQPVLICLPSVVVYRPSLNLYTRYSQTHPREFQTQADRLTHVLNLEPDVTLHWKDMIPYTSAYVSRDDSYVAARLSALFDRMNKPRQVRNGSELTFEDLRNSPAVLIGALNNRWTLQMTANLPFVFADEGDIGKIVEQKPSGRTWRPQLDERAAWTADFAVIARLFDSNTGQLLIIAAGLGGAGTLSAGEFLSHEDYLTEGLRTAPSNWRRKNMEAVLKTNITDGLAGPPHVVATHFW
jgi:hypothetical protein